MITAEVSNREVGVVLHDHPNLMKRVIVTRDTLTMC